MTDSEAQLAAPPTSGRVVLHPDIEIVSVREFPQDIRDRLGGEATDFILSDRTSRVGSQRIAEGAAMLLRRFREPKRIVEAVLEHSLELGRDPAAVLNETYPLLTSMRLHAVLVDPDTSSLRVMGPSLSVGDRFEGFCIMAQSSLLAETDVYQAEAPDGTRVAIKYLRAGSDATVRENLEREVRVLQHATASGCTVTPRLLDHDARRGDPFVCMEWLDGRTLFQLARSERGDIAGRGALALAVVDAYTTLHSSGILHGDVHPNNVFVLPNGGVRLIDLGGGRLIGAPDDHPRIGLVHYYEPEVATAVLAGTEPPLPSLLGEQFCIAGLAYTVMSGVPSMSLSLETETALDQIATQPIRRFEEAGVSWPAVEQVLARALSKEPLDRFPTTEAFRDALADAVQSPIPAQPETVASTASNERRSPALIDSGPDKCIRDFLDQFGLESAAIRTGLTRGPKASLYAGAGGIAWALLRIGCLRERADLLAAADVWIAKAIAQQSDQLAFTDGSIGAATETGRLALFHSVTGLHVTHALIRHASGDAGEMRQAVAAFLEAVPDAAFHREGELATAFPLDATNGAASLLQGASLLRPLLGDAHDDLRIRLERLGKLLAETIHHQFTPEMLGENRFLGYAHGRSGAIHALLRWSEAARQRPSPEIGEYLDRIADHTQQQGNGKKWPIEVTKPTLPGWSGWCHGSAGHLLTWVTAARMLNRQGDLERAEASGMHIWSVRGSSGPSLCCGAAGEALAFYELARATGDQLWVERGRELMAASIQAAHHTNDAQGLFRSGVGIALAAAESIEPSTSVWPICQSPL